MKIYHHLYELFPRTRIGAVAEATPRRGALLRVRFSDRKVGYADCHPWPELGDAPLSKQLDLLHQGKLTELTERSIELATLDAQARAAGKSLWEGVKIPESHALFPDRRTLSSLELESLAHQGFSLIKIKMGSGEVEEDAKWIKKNFAELRALKIKLRIDFNGALTSELFKKFLGELGSTQSVIDFVEDPTPYDAQVWREFQRSAVRIALDRCPLKMESSLEPDSFSVLVFKPAIRSLEWAKKMQSQFSVSLVTTTYADHPLGQVGAAWCAAQLEQSETAGLLSHTIYQFHPFMELIQTKKNILQPPPGTGWGFDELLRGIEWLPITK